MSESKPPTGLQDWIYSMETGRGRLWLRWALALLAAGLVFGFYLFTEARNFHNPEAMEKAQIARNLATGRGYTTLSIHPVTVRLLRERSIEQGSPDASPLRGPVPDLQHAPVYPVLLAGVFKLLPREWLTRLPADPFVQRPVAEQVITLFNLLWLGLAAWLTCRLGSRWFDPAVGRFAALALAFTELFWRMASNGLETNLLLVLVLLIAGTLHRLAELEPANSQTPVPLLPVLKWAASIGALLALACLTRYAVGWLLLPVLGFLIWLSPRRWTAAAVTLLAFALLVAPWLVRNHQLSGHLFGTAGQSIDALTMAYPTDQLERTFNTPAESSNLTDYRIKLAEQAAHILRNQGSNPGGNWMWFFFLVGILLPFQRPLLNRMRWFTLAILLTLLVVQALGTTHLSTHAARAMQLTSDVSLVHSENLLCLATPLFLLFGAAFLYTLLDSTHFGHPILLSTCIAGVWIAVSLPLLTCVLPPRNYPMAASYRPDLIQALSEFLEPQEIMMSDVPWAVAWYGDRACVWLPLHIQKEGGDDFFAVHDFQRPINALYLSPLTTEVAVRRMVTDIENQRWAWTYLDALVRNNLPRGFPLRVSYQGSARAGHLFLADRPRW